jgi:phosphoribosylamine---glycine ligase
MRVLIIGSGGREHAIAWKLRQSSRIDEIICAPGNAGIAEIVPVAPVQARDTAGLLDLAKRGRIDLTVVGPDDPLAAGIVDQFEQSGLRVFGPRQSAARFESSKAFAKDFMQRHQIPTARSAHFTDSSEAHLFCQKMKYPVVLKADGLALGKGVIIAENSDTAAKTIYRMMELGQFGDAGRRIVIEEYLRGEECSVHALVDGRSYMLFPAAQDHKRVFDGDAGPNTGGMGAYSPTPLMTPELEERVRREVLDRFIQGITAEQIPFKGLLYPGLMLTGHGPRVLEFNCRFGDPETQVLLPRLKSDLLDLIEAAIDGTLDACTPEWDQRATVCVVMASAGYPGASQTGQEIRGLDQFRNSTDVFIFHAGTRRNNGRLITAGGRVLGITAIGDDLRSARDRAYEAISAIHFEGAHFRTDIAQRALST